MDSDLGAIRRDLRAIVREVERVTGLTSRWNGVVHLREDIDAAGRPQFWAVKEWDCAIAIHQSAVTDPNLFCTLVHETFHSVSQGLNPRSHARFRGYEEGVIEQLTKLYGPAISEVLDVSADFELRSWFGDYVAHLETLRLAASMHRDEFYLDLLRTPLAEREDKLVQWAIVANPGDRPTRVLARISAALRGLRQ